jgi:hypothetical protein
MKLTELNTQDPKLARLNKYVAMVAFLWFVASLALLLFAGSNSAHASQPQPQPKRVQPKLAQPMTRLPELDTPAQQMTMRLHLEHSARG